MRFAGQGEKEKMVNVLDLFSLKGKVAVVTGGSGLYGRQITLALAQAGAKVYTASRNAEGNREYAEELCKEGYNVAGESFDQSDEKSIAGFLERIVAADKKVDVLINNSVLRTMKSFNDDLTNFSRSMDVNATGVFAISRIFGDHMAENGGGSIVNIGSYMGLLGADDTLYRNVDFSGFNSPDYFFHKGGMTNLTRFMASYYGPKKVRCNILEPGGFYCGQDELFVERYNDRTFLKRMANETDLMGAVLFLASDASSYITGAVIPVDGGYTAK